MLSYEAERPELFLGLSVGTGQCVALVEAAAHAPLDRAWRRGERVKGNSALPRGTAIATFDPDGRYGNHTDGRSHAALYLDQDGDGIRVIDQWIEHQPRGTWRRRASERTIGFGETHAAPVDNGDDYYVIS